MNLQAAADSLPADRISYATARRIIGNGIGSDSKADVDAVLALLAYHGFITRPIGAGGRAAPRDVLRCTPVVHERAAPAQRQPAQVAIRDEDGVVRDFSRGPEADAERARVLDALRRRRGTALLADLQYADSI